MIRIFFSLHYQYCIRLPSIPIPIESSHPINLIPFYFIQPKHTSDCPTPYIHPSIVHTILLSLAKKALFISSFIHSSNHPLIHSSIQFTLLPQILLRSSRFSVTSLRATSTHYFPFYSFHPSTIHHPSHHIIHWQSGNLHAPYTYCIHTTYIHIVHSSPIHLLHTYTYTLFNLFTLVSLNPRAVARIITPIDPLFLNHARNNPPPLTLSHTRITFDRPLHHNHTLSTLSFNPRDIDLYLQNKIKVAATAGLWLAFKITIPQITTVALN